MNEEDALLAKRVYGAYKRNYPSLTEEYVLDRIRWLKNNQPQNIIDMLIENERKSED